MDTFTFGKHKGKAVIAMCYVDPYYCLWADEHVKFFTLTDKQREIAEAEYWKKEDAKAEVAEEMYGFSWCDKWDG